MNVRAKFLSVLAAGAAVAYAAGPFTPAQAAAATYQVTDLGTLGGTSSFALDLNDARQVTGNGQEPLTEPSPRLNAFRWSPPAGPMQNLGVLPGSNNFSRGYAINNAGTIVGESDNNASNAFVYQGGVMSGLTSLQGGNTRGVAHDVNDAGAVVGISTANTAAGGTASRPTRWSGGVPVDLGSLDGADNTLGRAWGVNNLGTAVGVTRRTSTPTPVSQATLWTTPGSPLNLGSLQPDSFSEAFAVNDAGVAVGAAVNGATPGGSSIRRPVRWVDPGSGYQIEDLGTLGFTFGEAKDVNDAGQIVGFVTNISGSGQRAFLWENGVMTDLNTLVPAASGWILTTAEGINENGDIAGYGTIGGQTHAFLLTVPEPGGTALAALLAAGTLARRWRRRRQRHGGFGRAASTPTP